jgi:hypothetical protein
VNSKLKLIVLTAIVTTLAWVAVIATFFWWGSRTPSPSDRVHLQFLIETGMIGTVEMRNPKTQDVLIAVEQLPTGTNSTGRVQLSRQHLSAGGSVRIGVREISEDSK